MKKKTKKKISLKNEELDYNKKYLSMNKYFIHSLKDVLQTMKIKNKNLSIILNTICKNEYRELYLNHALLENGILIKNIVLYDITNKIIDIKELYIFKLNINNINKLILVGCRDLMDDILFYIKLDSTQNKFFDSKKFYNLKGGNIEDLLYKEDIQKHKKGLEEIEKEMTEYKRNLEKIYPNIKNIYFKHKKEKTIKPIITI